MRAIPFVGGTSRYNTNDTTDENSEENEVDDCNFIFLCKEINLTFEELNQITYAQAVEILLSARMQNRSNKNNIQETRKATQEDMDNF